LLWLLQDLWWQTASESLQQTVLLMLADLPPNAAILLLATADCMHSNLPEEVLALFPLPGAAPSAQVHNGSVVTYEITEPSHGEIEAFVDRILDELQRPVPRLRAVPSPQPAAPAAPTAASPAPTAASVRVPAAPDAIAPILSAEQEVEAESSLSPDALAAKLSQESELTRLLRMQLRSILVRLMRQFPLFEVPPHPDAYPDYTSIVATPTSLSLMLSYLNDRPEHEHYDALDNLTKQIDLLVGNTKEYVLHLKAAQTPGEPLPVDFRGAVNAVCHLQDTALSMLAQLEMKLVKQCKLIAEKRVLRKARQNAEEQRKQKEAEALAAAQKASLRSSARHAQTGVTLEAAAQIEESNNMEIDAAPPAVSAPTAADAPVPIKEEASQPEPVLPAKDEEMAVVVPVAASAAPAAASPSPAAEFAPSPPLLLSPALLQAFRTQLVSSLQRRGCNVESLELIGLELRKIVIKYHRNPDRDQAIREMRQKLNQLAD
jgi:hypothetical protein